MWSGGGEEWTEIVSGRYKIGIREPVEYIIHWETATNW